MIQLKGLENINHLVTTGLFSKIRHPMYDGFILWILGWADISWSGYKPIQLIREYGSKGNRVVFDYIQASVLRHENTFYGEAELVKSVHKAGEPWRFGIEPGEIESFAVTQGFEVNDHKCAQESWK